MRALFLLIFFAYSIDVTIAGGGSEELATSPRAPFCRSLMIAQLPTDERALRKISIKDLPEESVEDIKITLNNFKFAALDKENVETLPSSAFLRDIVANLGDAADIIWPLYEFLKQKDVRAFLTAHPVFLRHQSLEVSQVNYRIALNGMICVMNYIISISEKQ